MEKLPEMSSPPQIGSSSESESLINRRQIYAAERARLLLGSYRKGDANDPDTYVAAIAAVLADYPEDTIQFVTDPRTGVQRKFPKWMPNSGEVAEACEEHDGLRRRMDDWDARARQQLEYRSQLTIAGPRKSYEQIKAEFAEIGIHLGPKGSKPIDVGAFREKYGIPQEAWDAIPNAAKT